jgi:uncharacterized protein Veg
MEIERKRKTHLKRKHVQRLARLEERYARLLIAELEQERKMQAEAMRLEKKRWVDYAR